MQTTLLIYSEKSIPELLSTMTANLKLLNNYFSENNLKLNLTKTKFMVFQTKSPDNFSLTVDNNTIENVKIIKYLGMYIDKKFKMGRTH